MPVDATSSGVRGLRTGGFTWQPVRCVLDNTKLGTARENKRKPNTACVRVRVCVVHV